MTTPAMPVAPAVAEQILAAPAADGGELLPPIDGGPVGVAPPAAPVGLPPDVLQLQAQAAQYQQQMVAMQQQAAQAQAQAQQQQTQAETAQVMSQAQQAAQAAVRQMVEQGWDQRQAEIAASAYYQGEAQKFLRQQDQQRVGQQQKAQAVAMLSQQTGMPPAMLAGFNDWPSMVAAARQYVQTVGPQIG